MTVLVILVGIDAELGQLHSTLGVDALRLAVLLRH